MSCNHSQSNNGLITKIWGGPGWIFLHSVTFGYPINPTEEQKKYYKDFFFSLANVLPCRYCRESYYKFITEGETKLTMKDLQDRESLTKWFYNVHEAVNKKLGVEYGVSYDDIVLKYESFRAKCGPSTGNNIGCVTPLDEKKFSYRNLYQKDCPIIPLDLADPFVRVAKIRELPEKEFDFIKMAHAKKGNLVEIKNTSHWQVRNGECQQLIRHMREEGIPSIEIDGLWEGTPTINELKLLIRMSSNLNKSEIRDCIRKLIQKIEYLSQITTIY